MKLEEALPYLRKGKKIYRPDDPKERCLEGTLEKPLRSFYLTLFDGKVMIFKPEDQQLHPLIVNDGDILAEDWVKILEW